LFLLRGTHSIRPGVFSLELPVSVSAKVPLWNEMLNRKVKPADLFRKLHTSPQSVNRLVNIMHATKIDSIAEAMKALGARLTVSAC
jgi:antitoxin HicB